MILIPIDIMRPKSCPPANVPSGYLLTAKQSFYRNITKALILLKVGDKNPDIGIIRLSSTLNLSERDIDDVTRESTLSDEELKTLIVLKATHEEEGTLSPIPCGIIMNLYYFLKTCLILQGRCS